MGKNLVATALALAFSACNATVVPAEPLEAMPQFEAVTGRYVAIDGGRCTVVSVGPQLVATAGHCVGAPMALVVGPLGCASVTRAWVYDDGSAAAALDVALLALDEEVFPDYAVLAPGLPEPGAELVLGGYGCNKRLELKPATFDGEYPSGLLGLADTSICRGDSGGPVFGAVDGLLYGLVRSANFRGDSTVAAFGAAAPVESLLPIWP